MAAEEQRDQRERPHRRLVYGFRYRKASVDLLVQGESIAGLCFNRQQITFHERNSSQVKLFKDWTPKWPNQLRSRLIDKLNEIDSEFGLKLNQELEEALKVDEETTVVENGVDVPNGIDVVHNGVAMLAVTED